MRALNRSEFTLIRDALEILSPDNDGAERLRVELLGRIDREINRTALECSQCSSDRPCDCDPLSDVYPDWDYDAEPVLWLSYTDASYDSESGLYCNGCAPSDCEGTTPAEFSKYLEDLVRSGGKVADLACSVCMRTVAELIEQSAGRCQCPADGSIQCTHLDQEGLDNV